MKIITTEELRYLAECKAILEKEGVQLNLPKTKKMNLNHFLLVNEAVEVIEKNKSKMLQLGIRFDKKLHRDLSEKLTSSLKNLAGTLTGGITSSAKTAGSAAAGASVAGIGGLADKAMKKALGVDGDELASAIAKDPKAQQSLSQIDANLKQASQAATAVHSKIDSMVKSLPGDQTRGAKAGAKTALFSLEKAMGKSYEELKKELGDPDLARMIMTAASMKAVQKMSSAPGGAASTSLVGSKVTKP